MPGQSDMIQLENASSGSSQFSTENLQEKYRRGKCSPKRIAIVVVVLIVIVALAVGLGVGLSRRGTTTVTVTPSSTPSTTTEPIYKTDCLLWKDLKPPPFTPPVTKWKDMNCHENVQCPAGFEKPPLLLISLDGFREDYINRGFTPILKKMSECGSHAKFMRSIFPSKTFPNHFSIVTGLYPESHGIIDNSMYDKSMQEYFCLSCNSKFNPAWWLSEPIWITAKRQNKTTATFFWPGSDGPINGQYPDICYVYNGSIPYETRVREVLRWLDLPKEQRPDLMTLYYDEPDSSGHRGGPFSSEANQGLKRVDDIMEKLLDGLAQRNLSNCVDIIITADHGMDELSCSRVVPMDQYVDRNKNYIYLGPTGRITADYVWSSGGIKLQPGGDTPDQILEKLECKNFQLDATRKEDLPKRYHYANSNRIDRIVLEAHRQYTIQPNDRPNSFCTGGAHGWDPGYSSMHSLFLAMGPSFKANYIVEEFENTEVYNLMADLLGITPADNNGTRGLLNSILRSPPEAPHLPPPLANYSSCLYPGEEEAGKRESSPGCQCHNLGEYTNSSISELNKRLNLSHEDRSAALIRQANLGVPQLNHGGDAACQLVQHSYVSGYSIQYKMPLWTAYKLQEEDEYRRPHVKSRLSRQIENCMRPDVRLQQNQSVNCSAYTNRTANLTAAFLFPPGFIQETEEQFDALLSSNLVPMYQEFKDGVWNDALLLIEEYAEKYTNVHVLAGPVFDHDADGHRDELTDIEKTVGEENIPVPSHYFLTLTSCPEQLPNGTCPGSYSVMSVVLPHKQIVPNCRSRDTFEHMRIHSATVRDVERLTGLQFFTDLEFSERLWVITHLEVNLWERPTWIGSGCSHRQSSEGECPKEWGTTPPLILISLDGVRPDYLDRGFTPTLQQLKTCGVSAPYMRSVYPTVTFPNHYTQVTGLYPETHGIIDNKMYDTEMQSDFSLSGQGKLDPRWWGGEPIWNTVIKRGRKAMTMFWPGSDVPIQGMRPTEYFNYTKGVPNNFKIDTVVDWLGKNADFITLYISDVDSAGHSGGVDSRMVNESLVEVDRAMRRLMDDLYRRNWHQCVNIIVISDHGMADINCSRQEYVRKYIDEENMYVWTEAHGRVANQYKKNGTFSIIPTEDRISIEKIIDRLECHMKMVNSFKKSMFPKRHHYAYNNRIDSILLKVADTWMVGDRDPFLCHLKGMHGYEENFESMQALFIAHGTNFTYETEIEEFQNIEIYNLMTDLLGIEAEPNNGTKGALYEVINSDAFHSPPVPDPFMPYAVCEFPTPWPGLEHDCECDLGSSMTLDVRLNISDTNKIDLENRHLPHGRPYLYNNNTLCVLHHEDFVSGYSHEHQMPLWTTYTLSMLSGQRNSVAGELCTRPDPRVDQVSQSSCSNFSRMEAQNITRAQLFPAAFSSSPQSANDTALLSNTVPMLKGFAEGVWANLTQKVKVWASTSPVHVIVGPIFDYDYNGLFDPVEDILEQQRNNSVLVPSHYFLVALRCPGSSICSSMNYTSQGFILPHTDTILNCMPIDDYIKTNSARIRDIELLTGLQFLTANNTLEGVRTRIRQEQNVWIS